MHSALIPLLLEFLMLQFLVSSCMSVLYNAFKAFVLLQALSRRVITTEERACAACHTRIGNKIFAVFPDGTLVCFRCYKKADSHVCLATGRDFREKPANMSETWPE